MRIIFMGTPEFAVATLDQLVQSEHEVVAVITATDKLGGRGGKKVIQSDVKKYALEHGIPVLQPPRLKNKEFIKELQSYHADIQIVVAFRMLPEIVWNMPPLGTYNLHGSLLPKYRGAAPIHWAVINGEKETGVTFFKLKHEIDTGDVLLRSAIPIGEEETTGDIYNKLMHLGAKTVVDGLELIDSGDYELMPQLDVDATHAPKIYKETCEIDFNQTVEAIYNFVRGMNPFPGAWTPIDGKETKVYGLSYTEIKHNNEVGKIESDNKSFIHIYGSDGYVCLQDIKMAGKKRMNIKDFLNGYSLEGL